MHQLQQRDAAKQQQAGGGRSGKPVRLMWDDLRIFLVCADECSFRKAAGRLGVNSSTVVRRIERLEDAVGRRLFNRLPEGVALTRDGHVILGDARRMEDAATDLVRSNRLEEGDGGLVRIAISDGLGTYWVTPQLAAFRAEHPQIVPELNCGLEHPDLLRMEADLSIQFHRPEAKNLIVSRLGRLHLFPFAAPVYLGRCGRPSTAAELNGHALVDQSAADGQPSLWDALAEQSEGATMIGLRTNTSSSALHAIRSGAGIGLLPSYAAALGAGVEPVDIGYQRHLDIWLSYHPDMARSPRHKMVISWLKQIFDPSRFAWFRDEFVPPADLKPEGPGHPGPLFE